MANSIAALGQDGSLSPPVFRGCLVGVYLQRQLRLRVLEALEQRVKQFIIREDLWPIRVPHDPLSLDEVIHRIDTVTLEDVRDLAATLFRQPEILAVAGPA